MMDVLCTTGRRRNGSPVPPPARSHPCATANSRLLEEGTAPLEGHTEGVQWHTFAGGAINRLLAKGREQKSGKKWLAGNLSLRCKDLSMTAAGDTIRSLADLDWEEVAAGTARDMARGLVSKFQPCLPEEPKTVCSPNAYDRPRTLRFLATVKVNGVRLAPRPSGARLSDIEATGPMPLKFVRRSDSCALANPHNEVQWVDTPSALCTLSDELRTADVLGLDVETALDFGTLCLLQIATRERTYLVDPFAVGDLRPIWDVLSGTRPLKVIHNARFERRVLAASGIALDGVFDTMETSRRVRGTEAIGGHSLGMVCERELGIALDKSSQTSNWNRGPLDPDQLRYAALDAEVLLGLYDRFSKASLSQHQDEQAPNA